MGGRLTDAEKRAIWKTLCGLAVQLVGSQEKFRKEANVLKRITKQYGPAEVEMMLRGAMWLGWNSLLGLGSVDGDGRRKAREAYWAAENRKMGKRAPVNLQRLGDILKKRGLV